MQTTCPPQIPNVLVTGCTHVACDASLNTQTVWGYNGIVHLSALYWHTPKQLPGCAYPPSPCIASSPVNPKFIPSRQLYHRCGSGPQPTSILAVSIICTLLIAQRYPPPLQLPEAHDGCLLCSLDLRIEYSNRTDPTQCGTRR